MNIIFQILNNSLKYLYPISYDWGITIILLTVTVRLLLLPISIKQKASMEKQQKLSKEIEELKAKYKNNKRKLEEEMQKYYSQSTKGMMGCLVSLAQLPIVITLYNVVLKLPVQAATMLIPWVANIKLPDQYFIVPLLYALISMMPAILPYIGFLKSRYGMKPGKQDLIVRIVMSVPMLFITIKMPVAVGIYLITTGLFSFLEELVYLLIRRKTVIAVN